MKFSRFEKNELFKAWFALSLAFAIAFNGGLSGLLAGPAFIRAFIVAGLTVGVGFIAHELSHKLLAQRYGCWAEFRAFNRMLMMAIIFSLFGFIIAAPGGVFIKGKVSKEKNGKISAAGIIANLIVASLFFILAFLFPHPIVIIIAVYGMLINSWLALFNLIPFLGFDGSKVLAWNKGVYGVLVTASLILMYLSSGIVVA